MLRHMHDNVLVTVEHEGCIKSFTMVKQAVMMHHTELTEKSTSIANGELFMK